MITSYDPLKIYVYKDGLVRFATEKYTSNPKSLKKRYIHLTNYSVNKKNEANYVENKDEDAIIEPLPAEGELESDVSEDEETPEEENASKWNFKQLEAKYNELGIDYNEIWEKIKDIARKAVISVEGHIYNNMSRLSKSRAACFEIYGFDILLDHKL